MKKLLLAIVLSVGCSGVMLGQTTPMVHDPISHIGNVLGLSKSLQEAISATGELRKNVETAKSTLNVISKTQDYLNKASDFILQLEEIKQSTEILARTVRFVQQTQRNITQNRQYFTVRQTREILDYYTWTLQSSTQSVKRISSIVKSWQNATDKDRKDAVEDEHKKLKDQFDQTIQGDALIQNHIKAQERLQDLAFAHALTKYDLLQTIPVEGYINDLPPYLQLRESIIKTYSKVTLKLNTSYIANAKPSPQQPTFRAAVNEYKPQFVLYRRIYYIATALVFLLGIAKGWIALQRDDGSFSSVVQNFGLSIIVMIAVGQLAEYLFI